MGSTELHVVFGTGQVGSQLVDRLLARRLRVRHPFAMSDARIRSLLGISPTPFAEQISTTADWLRRRMQSGSAK